MLLELRYDIRRNSTAETLLVGIQYIVTLLLNAGSVKSEKHRIDIHC
jgi:hypothetical protein